MIWNEVTSFENNAVLSFTFIQGNKIRGVTLARVEKSPREKIDGSGSATVLTVGGCGFLNEGRTSKKPRSDYKVFSSGNIGNLQVKNRLVKTSTATAATTDDYTFLSGGIDMFRNWSKGGVGLIITGHMGIVPTSKGAYSHLLTCIHDDKFIPQLSKIAEAVHNADSDCKVIAQINHIGMNSAVNPVAPSLVPWPFIKRKLKALSTIEVQEIIDQFVAAARRAREAGFDGVEIHGAHTYLLNTFLSPYTNQRTDQYGGST